MAYKFPCNYCKNEIFIQYLKTGEEAKCRNCGKVIPVPDDKITIADSEVPRFSKPFNREDSRSSDDNETPDSICDKYMPTAFWGLSLLFWGAYMYSRTEMYGWSESLHQFLQGLFPLYILSSIIGVIIWSYIHNKTKERIENLLGRRINDFAKYGSWRQYKPIFYLSSLILIIEIVNAILKNG